MDHQKEEKPLITVAQSAKAFVTDAMMSEQFFRRVYTRFVQCAAKVLDTDEGRSAVIDHLLRLPDGANYLPNSKYLPVVMDAFNKSAKMSGVALSPLYQGAVWDLAEAGKQLAPQLMSKTPEPQYIPLFLASLKDKDSILYPILYAGLSEAAETAYKMAIGNRAIVVDQSLIIKPGLS